MEASAMMQINARPSGRDALVALAKRDNLTVRQLAQMVGGHGGLQRVDTAGEIASTVHGMETKTALHPTIACLLDKPVKEAGIIATCLT